jgi:hypothetical protein
MSKGALGNYPHPMIVYNKILWIADGQYLHSYDGSIATAPALDLGANQTIYALGIDPGSGQMLISSSVGVDPSVLYSGPRFVWLFDGASSRPSRVIPTNDLVLSFYSVGGTVFVGTTKNIGIWNGNGIQVIHRLLNTTYDSNTEPYKSHLTSLGNVLYFIDGKNMYAYGEVSQVNNFYMMALRVFYPCFQPVAGTAVQDYIDFVTNIGSGGLGVFYKSTVATNIFSILDTTTAGAGGTLVSNRYEFPRPIVLHRIRVFTTGVTANATAGVVSVMDETGTVITPVNQMGIAAGTKNYFDFDFGGKNMQTAQFNVNLGYSGLGLNRIVAYYDWAE